MTAAIVCVVLAVLLIVRDTMARRTERRLRARLAEVRGEPLETIAALTASNFQKLFMR